MNKSKTFNVTINRTHEFQASVASMFVRSDSSYKGEFEFISDLQNIIVHNGDYADVFETNSQWVYENNQWVNTDKEILINPLVVKQSEVSHEAYPNSIVKRDDIGNIQITEPQYDSNATTKQYVDLKNTSQDANIDILQQNITEIQQELGNIGDVLDEFAGSILGVSGTATLFASSWSDNSYSLTVSALGANDAIFFSPATSADKTALESASIFVSVNGTSVTFMAGSTPSANISLNYFIARGKADA